MIGPLKTLFGLQRRRLDEDRALVSRIDPSRTILLEDLIDDMRRPARLALLGAPWLDAARFTSRIASACAWLDGIRVPDPAKGWAGVPLYFFQAASAEDDEEAHHAMLEIEREEPAVFRRYTERYAHLPTGVQYLHIHARTSWMLEGAYADGRLRLRPLFTTFSTYSQAWVMDGERTYHPVRGKLVGYPVTDLPTVLGVSPAIATDFLARVVVHDLCHAYLPTTPQEAEGFHNAAALAAMGTLPRIRYREAWEEFIHAECTDPAFCLRADAEIAAMRKALGTPSPTQGDILEGYRRWYAHPNAARKRKEAWGLPEGAAAETLRSAIEEARADGFRLYARLMKTS